MPATIIDGKAIASKIREEQKEKTATLKEKGITPCLAVVLVGEDPGSVSYVKGKQKALPESGMEGKDIRLPENTSEEQLLSIIATLNDDDMVHGILLQLPLPKHIREQPVINAINPRKDVDCFHPINLGKLLLGEETFLPCTPHGILVLLRETGITTQGRHIVVVGRSNIVGKPLALLLASREQNATVTICHTGTKDLSLHTLQADILIAAAGVPHLITGPMIKQGAAVIDVGVNRLPGSPKLVGDVLFDEAIEKASFITPVPGGVGPMTIAMLLENLLKSAASSVF